MRPYHSDGVTDDQYFSRRVGHVYELLESIDVPRPNIEFRAAPRRGNHGRYYSSENLVVIYAGAPRGVFGLTGMRKHAEVFAHEVGHYIDHLLRWGSQKYWRLIVGEKLGLDPTHSGWRTPVEDFADSFMMATGLAMMDPHGEEYTIAEFIGARRAAALDVALTKAAMKWEPKAVWAFMHEAAERTKS